jgi:hypothetical protein
MKTLGIWFLGFAILVGSAMRAQNPALTPFQVVAGGVHTLCDIATGEYCLATDGIWYSPNGTSWTQIGGSAGVASFNGRTGAVTLTDSDVTGTGLKVTTTVTSTATSTPQ